MAALYIGKGRKPVENEETGVNGIYLFIIRVFIFREISKFMLNEISKCLKYHLCSEHYMLLFTSGICSNR